MNRRSFLAALAAGLALDPERALWRPGAKLISVPKPPSVLISEYFRTSLTFSLSNLSSEELRREVIEACG